MRVFDNEIKNEFLNLFMNCRAMEFTWKEADGYLDSHGFKTSESTYYRVRRAMIRDDIKRVHHIAVKGLVEQHLKRLEKLEAIEHELWINYHRLLGKKPERAVMLLPALYQIQPYISQAYRVLKEVMEEQARMKGIYEKYQREIENGNALQRNNGRTGL
jgi:hypothetical protein